MKIFMIQVFWGQCSVFSNTNVRTLNHTHAKDEITEGWTKVHNEELHDICSSTNIIRATELRRMRWVGHLAHIGNMRNGDRVFTEHLKEKDHLEDLGIYLRINTRVIIKKLDKDGMDWIHMLQNRDKCKVLVNMVLNMRFPQNLMNFFN